MANPILRYYDKLVSELTKAKRETLEARRRYDTAKAKQESLEAEMEITREHIDEILWAAEPPKQAAPAQDAPVPEVRDAKPEPVAPPFGHRPSIRATVRAIPKDGDITTAEIREALGLSEGATYTRIQKAKKAGLVESAGWGKYKLTEEGKKIHVPVLKAVPAADGK